MSAEITSARLIKLAVSAAALAIFVLVTALTNSNLGALSAFGFLAVVVASYATWDFRKRPFYWPTVGLLSAAHVVALLTWHPTIPSPAIKVAPVVMIDFVCMVLLLFGLERLWVGKQK